MKSSEVIVKVKTGLNKLDSQDYQNIDVWIIQQEYNKAAIDWTRGQLNGMNIRREGKEQSAINIDDLQILLKSDKLSGIDKGIYFMSQKLPKDYIRHSRTTPYVSRGTCSTPKTIVSELVEEGNVMVYLKDFNNQPSFDFEQTFHTLVSNKVRIYHNKDFEIKEADLLYYREPKYVSFPNAPLPNGGVGVDEEIEFKKDIVELIVELTIKNIAGNIESINRMQIAQQKTDELK
jgi:hypothetical protein